MIQTWETELVIPSELEAVVRDVVASNPNLLRHEILKWGPFTDFYIVRGGVKLHIDRRQQTRNITQGFVVINDSDQRLVGSNLALRMPPGSVYQLDGQELHGTQVPLGNNPNGLLAFLAWDIPVDDIIPVARFAQEALESVMYQLLGVEPKLEDPDVYRNRSRAVQGRDPTTKG